jgi:SAM-dependent methyltransferase
MRPRLALARALVRLGGFVQSLALPVMRPPDIFELNRRQYARPDLLDTMVGEQYVDSGLTEGETEALERVSFRTGRLLDLGSGGGREAIALARKGYEVTCIDFSPALIKATKVHAARHGLRIEALTRELTRLDLPAESFDIAFLTAQMYSSLPGSKNRVRMLRGVADVLRPGGVFLLQFRWQPQAARSRIGAVVRKLVAFLSFNAGYQAGDQLLGNPEFAHCFSSENSVRGEFERGGFDVSDLWFDDRLWSGWAVLKKARRS